MSDVVDVLQQVETEEGTKVLLPVTRAGNVAIETGGTLGEKLEEIDTSIKTVTDVKVDLDTHKKDTTIHITGDERKKWNGAVTDMGLKTNLKTSNKKTLVDAINETFQNASNGKSDIAAVIGKPATNGDTFAKLKSHIQDNKNTLAKNLTDKGQKSTGTETLANLVAKVAKVNTGKRMKTGTIKTGSRRDSVKLSFIPTILLAVEEDREIPDVFGRWYIDNGWRRINPSVSSWETDLFEYIDGKATSTIDLNSDPEISYIWMAIE